MRSHMLCPSTIIFLPHKQSLWPPGPATLASWLLWTLRTFAPAGPSAENPVPTDPSPPTAVCSRMTSLVRPSLTTHLKTALYPNPIPSLLSCFVLLHSTHQPSDTLWILLCTCFSARAGFFFCLLLYPWQYLAHRKLSINICWMNETDLTDAQQCLEQVTLLPAVCFITIKSR